VHEFPRDEAAVVTGAVEPESKPKKPRLVRRVVQLVKHIVDVFNVCLQEHDVPRQVVDRAVDLDARVLVLVVKER
jgi:hypothetical protein